MIVRALSPADLPAYRALMLHAYEHAPDAFTSTAAERAAQPDSWWRARIADPAGLGLAFGCFDAGALAGSAAVEFSAKPKTRHKALVIGMYVLPPARGRGAARSLLHAAIEHCRQRTGVKVVQLTVTQGNEAALALYRSAGFREFGVEPMAISAPAGYLAKVHMWLPLQPGSAEDAPGAPGSQPRG